MARTNINTGTVDNDPSADSIRSAFNQVNAMTLELYAGATASGIPAYNVMAPPYNAAGNDSTDDTAAIQAAINAANAAGGGLVVFPAKAYKISSTLTRQQGVTLWGIPRGGVTSATPARIKWYGAADGIMMDTTVNALNIPGTITHGIFLDGRAIAGVGYRFAGINPANQGRVDQGTIFEHCQWASFTGDAIQLNDGCTNFCIRDCRWDQIGGYAIYARVLNAQVNFTVEGQNTYDNFIYGTPESSAGFLHLDGANGASNVRAQVAIRDLHVEINGQLKTVYPSGASEPEKRGIVRLSVNPLNASKVQFVLELQNWVVSSGTAAPTPTTPYSMVLFTGGTSANHLDSARVSMRNISGLGTWDSNTKWNVLAGNVGAGAWPHQGVGAVRQCAEYLLAASTNVTESARVYHWPTTM